MGFVNLEDARELARRIAGEELAPRAAAVDRDRTFPRDNVKVLGEAGFHGLIVSESEGGLGLGRSAFAAAVAEIARACASTALVYVSHSAAAKAVELAGSEDLKRRWLPEMTGGRALGAFAVHEPDSGSNAGAIATRAVRDGDRYIVNGTKFFITSAGEADTYLVLVRTDPEKGPRGMSTLLVSKDAPDCPSAARKTRWV